MSDGAPRAEGSLETTTLNDGSRETEQRGAFERAVTDEIMPLIVRLGLGEYWRRYQLLLADEGRSPEELAEEQWRAFHDLLSHAYSTVPFYRQAMDRVAMPPEKVRDRDDLTRLPTLDKRAIVASFPDRITSNASERSTWRYRSTSGTALRIMSVTDYDARQWRYALHLRSMKLAADYEVGRRQAVIRTQACTEVCSATVGEELHTSGAAALPIERHWPPFGLAQLTLQETLFDPLDERDSSAAAQRLDRYLDQLDDVAPYLLRGLPQYILQLARRLRAQGRRPPPIRRIVVQDSLATAELKREIAEAFECEVRETYGSSELGSLAAECEAGALHLASRLFLVEVLRPDGGLTTPGETGILAVSAMTNRAMPLLRYRLGDLGRLLTGSCACGRQTPRLAVEGRLQETLPLADGFLTARQLQHLLVDVPGVEQFQLIERAPGKLELHVVPTVGTPFVETDLEASLRRLLDDGASIRCRRVRRIAPEESGKYAMIKTLVRDFYPREA